MGKTKVNIPNLSKASLRNVRVSPRKARLVVDLVRGKSVERAVDILDNNHRKTSPMLKKLILSAVSNAKERHGVEGEDLFVKAVWVDEAKMMKGFLPRAQGRATPLRKRRSHITVVLDELGAK